MSIARKYDDIGALVGYAHGWYVIDRAVFTNGPTKNLRKRYQVIDDNERVIGLERSKEKACAMLRYSD